MSTTMDGAPNHMILLLANAMVVLAEHPEQWDLLASRTELAERAVEEVMR